MLPAYEPLPSDAALVSESVPAVIVVLPVNVLVPVSSRVPRLLSAGDMSSAPLPVAIAALLSVALASITCTVRSRFVADTPLVSVNVPAST